MRIAPDRRRRLDPGAADAPRELAVRSLTPLGQPDVDLSAFAPIDIVSREVTVDAVMGLPSGEAERRTLLVTLERAIGRAGGATREGRWLVAAVARPRGAD